MTSPLESLVELQFHRIQVPEQSFSIRVFLNLPEANADTRTEGNDNYAGAIHMFGHGGCAGDEGHCDVPDPDQPRAAYDLRKKHHLKPFEYDMDVTETFSKVAAMSDEVQVNLVFVDARGKEIADSDLEIGGISLVVQE